MKYTVEMAPKAFSFPSFLSKEFDSLRLVGKTAYIYHSHISLSEGIRLSPPGGYRDDVYDRIWQPLGMDEWTQVNTSLSDDDLTQNEYKPPAIVMSTAATPINSSAAFELSWNSGDVTVQYKLYMHFNEVEKLKPNESRSFNIILNDKFWHGPIVPSYQKVNTTFTSSTLYGATSYRFSLIKTETSTLPPIINAYEIYMVKNLSQQESEQDNVDAITNIKKTYGVVRNWQGDPCAPIAYKWEGLNCSFGDDKPPRITYL